MGSQKRDPKTDPRAALGEAFRQLRADCGYTQASAAARLNGYGEDSVSKTETGGQVPTDDLYARLLTLYQVTAREKALLDVMLGNARAAQGKVPEFFEKYVEAEEKAAFLHLWGLLLIPGPLQTRELAHAMFLAGGYDEDGAAEQADLRVRRRAKVDGPDAAHVIALIYQPVLHLRVGTAQTMSGQMDHLLELSQKRNVIIQVIPDTGYFPGMEGQFEIASGPAIPDTLAMVTVKDQVTDDQTEVREVVALFEEIRGYALNAVESRTVITEALQRWNSQQ